MTDNTSLAARITDELIAGIGRGEIKAQGQAMDLLEELRAALTKPAVPDDPSDGDIITFCGRFHDPDDNSYGADTRQWIRALRAALTQSPTCCEAERERCAKIADERQIAWKTDSNNHGGDDYWDGGADACKQVATAIRGADQ